MNWIILYFLVSFIATATCFACAWIFTGKPDKRYWNIYLLAWGTFFLFWPIFILAAIMRFILKAFTNETGD